MVFGKDKSKKTVVNDLTYMFLKSILHTSMAYSGVSLCYTKDTPKDLLLLCCNLLSEDYSHPAIFNDEVIIKGLISYGVSPEDACEYIHSTCVEITPCATSACWVASPYINLLQILLDMLGIKGK
ncbi:MAG: pyruvate formate lyase family protein [Oscillospiraceae bacterium]